ncbi:multicopper oxidase domain-containing protein [Verrucomicrobiaceae bacterium 227]
MFLKLFRHPFLYALVCLSFALPASAKIVEYDLTINETKLAPAGKTREALTINGGIPGPTLRFREGDTAVLRVHNHLKNEDTSIHWHGLLVPNAEDGVPYLTTPPIQPGKTRTFRFPLRHSGTYWYHSHTGLQEQRGVYGSIVVTPRGGERVKSDQDHVLVLSDWTNEKPEEVMRTLMRGSEWYAIRKGNAQSLFGAAKAGKLKDYLDREKVRMPPMDVSDVAYDAFLINGKSRSEINARPGDRVRLRLINAGASSYFYAHSATGPLTIVSADGSDVVPMKVNRLLIGMAETYDVIVTIPSNGSFEFRTTAQDNSGHASVFLGEGERVMAGELPSPNLYSMDEMLSGALQDADAPLDGLRTASRPTAPYAFLKSPKPTDFKGKEVRKIELRLTGDMTRYLWSFNGKTLGEDSTIPVNQGEVLEIELINDTMMHHPLHLHGHFFRMLNRYGANSPLKHTVDVPPMGRRTIQFLANEEGDWFFHCHLLYHMDAGMARVFSYQAAVDPTHKPSLDPKLINPSFLMVDGMVQNNMTMGNATLMKGRENYGLMWDYGFHEHKEYEIDGYWSHYFNPRFSTVAGYRFTNQDASEDRAFAGVSYLLPYFVQGSLSIDSEGDARMGLAKELQLTPRLSLFGDIEYDTNTDLEWTAGASYLINKEISITGSYHNEHGWGAGFGFRF